MLGLLAALLVTASPCPATPSFSSLPNYKPNAPVRSKLGTGHVLTGVVREADTCRPLTHARVELWQHGPEGYTRRWSATVFTDSAGRYRFEAPVPTSYRAARPHIHLRVSLLGYSAVSTVYVLRAGEKRGRFDIALEGPARPA